MSSSEYFEIEKTIPSDYKSRVYSLIIGIDKYASPDMPSLSGCVNDAKTFEAFVTERLHVPRSQIVLLTNEAAARSAIISSFDKHLTTNTNIDEGDAIIFFYAGHGSRVVAPDDWPAPDGMIETLCPHDEMMQDEKGRDIYGIPDRTINAMLRNLAAVKGDNITVVLDCCHSGGITRQSSDSALRVRFAKTPATIKFPPLLDKEIWDSDPTRTADVDVPVGFRHKFMASHVLLAACQPEQNAYETTAGNGLLLLPELDDQRPHCEGQNANRVLFNRIAAPVDRKTFQIVNIKGRVEVQAGHLHGIVVGTEFVVQDLGTITSPREGQNILVALSVNMGSAILGHRPGTNKFDVPQGARAIVSDWKNDAVKLKVAVELDDEDQVAQTLFPDPDLTQPDQVERVLRAKFVKVVSRVGADIVVKRDDRRDQSLTIERLDAIIPKYADVTIQFDPANNIRRLPYIFDAVAQFNYNLSRHHADNLFDQLVSLEMFKLCKPSPDWARMPDKKLGNLLINSHARIPADHEARYGLAITNHSEHDLFPYLFYFDPSDYSITDFFVPPSPTCAAPLRARQGSSPTRVTVGYGAGGGDPIMFNSRDELSDTGFFKLFVFSKYVDMTWLNQGPAFDACGSRGPVVIRDEVENWDAWIVAVTVDPGR